MKKYLVIFTFAFICMCAPVSSISWTDFGVINTGTFNEHVKQAKENHKKDLENQVKIAQITADMSSELKYWAKKEDDKSMWERAVALEVRAKMAAKEAGILSKVEWKQAPEPGFDWMNIVQMILSGLGLAGIPGMAIGAKVLSGVKKQAKETEERYFKEKKKAIKYAHSTQVDQYEDD